MDVAGSLEVKTNTIHRALTPHAHRARTKWASYLRCITFHMFSRAVACTHLWRTIRSTFVTMFVQCPAVEWFHCFDFTFRFFVNYTWADTEERTEGTACSHVFKQRSRRWFLVVLDAWIVKVSWQTQPAAFMVATRFACVPSLHRPPSVLPCPWRKFGRFFFGAGHEDPRPQRHDNPTACVWVLVECGCISVK